MRQGNVTRLASQTQQGLCRKMTFSLLLKITNDAEQVTSVNPLRKRTKRVFGLKDGNSSNDRFQWVSSDRKSDMAFGVKQLESGKSRIKEGSNIRPLSSLQRLLS
jgi:hypothetical protein